MKLRIPISTIITFIFIVVIIPLIGAQDLKIATFNCEFLVERKVHIKYGLPFDMKYAEAASKKEWEAKNFRKKKFEESTQKVAAHIKEINADVLGLVEVGNESEIKFLVEKLREIGLDYPYWEVCKSEDTATGQHVALLSKYELTDVKLFFPNRGLYFTESDYDETSETGLSKAMAASVTVKNQKLNLFLFHLKSERGGEESDQQRLMQAEIVRRLIIPYLRNGEHVIVFGDLNSESRHETLLKIRGFRDMEEELIQTGDDNYFENYDTRWTYNYKGRFEQIDHILLSLSIKEQCIRNNPKQNKWGIKTSIIPTTDKEVSDHNALLVELNFKD